MFLVDRYLLPQNISNAIGTITWSDHAPVKLGVLLTETAVFPFSWRNNTYIHSNPTEQSFLTNKLDKFFLLNSSPDIAASTLWKAHKAYM